MIRLRANANFTKADCVFTTDQVAEVPDWLGDLLIPEILTGLLTRLPDEDEPEVTDDRWASAGQPATAAPLDERGWT